MGRRKASAGCIASRWAATQASVASTVPSSRCSVGDGRKPSRRRARRATSSSGSVSWMPSATPTTRSARSGCAWATSRPLPRHSIGRTNSATTPSPACRCCSLPVVRSTRRRSRSAARSPWLRAAEGPPIERPGPGCSPLRWTSPSPQVTSKRRDRPSQSWSRSQPNSRGPCSKPAPSRGEANCSLERIGRRRPRPSWDGRGGCGRRRTCRTRARERACGTPRR